MFHWHCYVEQLLNDLLKPSNKANLKSLQGPILVDGVWIRQQAILRTGFSLHCFFNKDRIVQLKPFSHSLLSTVSTFNNSCSIFFNGPSISVSLHLFARCSFIFLNKLCELTFKFYVSFSHEVRSAHPIVVWERLLLGQYWSTVRFTPRPRRCYTTFHLVKLKWYKT